MSAGYAFAEQSLSDMNYSQFLDFCKGYNPSQWDSMPIDERLLSNLCDFRELGFGEKQWIWLNGSKLDWRNFAQKATERYAQTIPEFVTNGINSTLKVSSYVSGRESFPPPMGATISFEYHTNWSIEHFKQSYIIRLNGDLVEDATSLYTGIDVTQSMSDIHEIEDYQNFILVSAIGIPILAGAVGFVIWGKRKKA